MVLLCRTLASLAATEDNLRRVPARRWPANRSQRAKRAFWRRLAERVGFEPTCRLPDKTLSRRPRYDHFGTSPLNWHS